MVLNLSELFLIHDHALTYQLVLLRCLNGLDKACVGWTSDDGGIEVTFYTFTFGGFDHFPP